MSGDVAVIGAHLDNNAGTESGSAYVFRFDFDGTTWTWNEEAKLTAVVCAPLGLDVSLQDRRTQYNVGNFLCRLALPRSVKHRSLITIYGRG